jgi:hypothetical protein
MAFKNPITVQKLHKIKLPIYGKTLKVILKNKFLEGTVRFLMVLDHEYPGADKVKNAKFPFLLLGDPMDGWVKWKDFGAEAAKSGGGKKQKDFMRGGTCTREGDQLLLVFDKTIGKSTAPIGPIMKKLTKLIKGINPKLTITTKEAPKTEEVAAGAAGAAVGGETVQDKTSDTKTTPEQKEKPKVSDEQKDKLVNKYKEEKQDDAKKLGEQFDELNTMSSSDAIKKVTANIKRGRTTKKDLKVVKELNKVFSTTEKLYKGTAKQVQQKFDKPYKELAKNKKKFYELSLATKQSKKSLAETIAHSYYENKQKRAATKDEVKDIQKIVKDVILMNKKRRKKAKQALLFKATSFVLKKTGPNNFKAKYVNQILQKKVA